MSARIIHSRQGQLPEQQVSDTKVIRGGSFKSNQDQPTVTYRFGWRATEDKSYTETPV